MTELSVVIICWNSERHVKACLDSVLESTEGFSKEIIIIDNGSTDKTLSIIRSYSEGSFSLICNSENLGVSKARNIGLRKACGKYIWILDIDTVVNKEAVSGMLEFIENQSDCGICGCKLKNFQGNVQESCRKHPSLGFKINNVLESLFNKMPFTRPLRNWVHRHNESQFYRQQVQLETPFEVEYVIGACQMIRSVALEKTGLLDENIFYGPEDADLCLRMQKEYYKVYFLPAFTIIHDYQQMTNKKIISPMAFVHLKALIYFFRKHKRF